MHFLKKYYRLLEHLTSLWDNDLLTGSVGAELIYGNNCFDMLKELEVYLQTNKLKYTLLTDTEINEFIVDYGCRTNNYKDHYDLIKEVELLIKSKNEY